MDVTTPQPVSASDSSGTAPSPFPGTSGEGRGDGSYRSTEVVPASTPLQKAAGGDTGGTTLLSLLLITCLTIVMGFLAGRVPRSPASWTMLSEHAAKQLSEKIIPLWPLHGEAGPRLMGGGRVGVFYPTTLLPLALSPMWSRTLDAAMHLWLAGMGAWLLARRAKITGWPRLLVGLAFVAGAFTLLLLNPGQLRVVAWLPWALMTLERLIERSSLWRLMAASLILATQFLAGRAAASAGLLNVCLLLYLARLSWTNRLAALRAAPALLAAVLIGFAIAGVQWMPTVIAEPRVALPLPWRISWSLAGEDGERTGILAALLPAAVLGIALMVLGLAQARLRLWLLTLATAIMPLAFAIPADRPIVAQQQSGPAGNAATVLLPSSSARLDRPLESLPAGWRYGLFTSTGGVLILLLVIGSAMFGESDAPEEAVK